MTDILTPAQVAQWLQMSEWTVKRGARDGSIPGARKVRGSWRFSRRVLEVWFYGEQPTADGPGGAAPAPGGPPPSVAGP